MSMKDRDRAKLPTVETSDESSQDSVLTDSHLEEIADHLTAIRNLQGSLQEGFFRMKDEVSATLASIQQETRAAAAEREQFNAQIKEILTGVRAVMKSLDEQVKGYTNKHDQALSQASIEVKSLKGELTTGLMGLARAVTPIKQRLQTVGIIAGSSAMGGVIVFLVMFILLGPHSGTVVKVR